MALDDNFMYFPEMGEGILPRGESSDTYYEKRGAFEINGVKFTVSQSDETLSQGQKGAAKGRAKFANVTVDKEVDSSSATLFKACTKGARFPEVILVIRRSGAQPINYVQYVLQDVAITGIDWEVQADKPPSEKITLSYVALGFRYYPQKSDGSAGTPKTWSWSTATNDSGPSNFLGPYD